MQTGFPAQWPEGLPAKPGLRRVPSWVSRLFGLLLATGIAPLAVASTDRLAEIIDTPFEQLLQTEIITADKLARQISGAPSAVSIVTARDIRDFGYRTLGEILGSMRGLSMLHDETYGYLGGRGYTNPGEYAGRITLLIDGYRAPDNYWGQAFFGNDGILDVELIERVEYIPGSGSSSHGDSAFLGVINIITRMGRDVAAASLTTELGSHGWRRQRLGVGRKFDNGVDLLFSTSSLSTSGRAQREPFSADTATYNYEQDKNRRYFLKLAYGDWTLETAAASRQHINPYDSESLNDDINRFASLKYDNELSPGIRVSNHLYVGHYRYRSSYMGLRDYDGGGNWRGFDSKLVNNRFAGQTLVFGLEYRDDYRQGATSQYDPDAPSEQAYTQRQTWSLYAYDDLRLNDQLQLNFGGRVDLRDKDRATFSPRAAVIYAPTAGTTLKLSTGIANRQPVAVDESYLDDLRIERLRTHELVWEQAFGPHTRLTGALYTYRINNHELALDFDTDRYRTRFGSLAARGAELELEHLWRNGVRLRTSYVRQDARDSEDQRRPYLARHIAKLNLSAPIAGDWLRAGLSVRHLGRRQDRDKTDYPASTVGDLTLSADWQAWSASISIRNLGNARHVEPGGYEADRRNVWFQLGYQFK